MTKLPVSYSPAPERREGLASRAFRLVWSLCCWTAVFVVTIVAWAALVH